MQQDPDRMRRLSLDDEVGLHVLRNFEGLTVTPELRRILAAGEAAGVTLYRDANVESPAQLRELARQLQASLPAGAPPLLVATDQEGGQLQAIGDGATAWPGNLALGATRSPDLARRTGAAIGRELSAMGINVNFAPVGDLVGDKRNAAVGLRSFGSDPDAVAQLVAAFVEGQQNEGVAAVVKHFPGHGSVRLDSHYAMPVIDRSRAELERSELVPFRGAIEAGVRLVMSGHLAAPALTGNPAEAATVSPAILGRVLRDEMGFQGAVVSDAMDMLGIAADGTAEACVRAVAAGVDLLCLHNDEATQKEVCRRLLAAALAGALDEGALHGSANRVLELRRWCAASVQPPIDVCDSAEHRAVARETAERSVTLVRDGAVLPIGPGRVLVVAPPPTRLTPADTSLFLRLDLAERLRAAGVEATALESTMDPTDGEIAAISDRAAEADVIVVGTVDAIAHDGQAALVRRLVASGRNIVAVALRGPFDLEAYPEAETYVCTYGIQPPQIEALANGLLGRIEFRGRLPVTLDIR